MSEPISDLKVICLESRAFYALIDEVTARIKATHHIEVDHWIDEHEAMQLLRITSKTSLQKYRDERRIRFSALSRKVIVYDRQSILDYIENQAKNAIQ